MPSFDSNGVPIHYEVFGEGRPIVLVHGFASSLKANWLATGWMDTLSPLRQVIALDCRGHGESGKPHDPQAYGGGAMTDDVTRLMDHLDIDQAEICGYSMGGGISLRALVRHPQRFTAGVLGGIGDVQRRGGRRPNVAQALLSEDPSAVTDVVARGFRAFAEAGGNDLRALAAMQQSPREVLERSDLAGISVPVLIVVGENDGIAGSADALEESIPGARLVTIPGKDHLTVVADQRFKDAVTEFLKAR
jgi:pimeloyl-ACP methyl ester carboxylesterase